jgi:nucleoside-diphosphate-sugar epimerase
MVDGKGKKLDNKVFNEEDWAIEATCPPYPKSKLMAERAAWDFIKSIPERNLEIVVINPSYILGPLLSKYGGDTSRTLITRLLQNDMPGLAETQFQTVDVRDVANAHVIALTNPNAPGHRFCCYQSSIWMKDVAAILDKEFKVKGYKIPTNLVPNALVWVVSFWDKAAENIYPRLGKDINISNEKIKLNFGMEFRDVRESIIEMANTIIEFDGI